ncbi:MAG: S9 family peptidase [Myxococcaceae bacterium]|nr:S9 family peptidase [Myxococcaceae bacterium]
MQALLMTIVAATASADPSFLREFAQTRRYLAGRPANVRLTPDGKTVLFLRAKPTSPEQTLFSFDVATGQTVELLTPESLLNGAAETLSVEEKARLERMRVSARGFISFQLSPDGTRVLVGLSGKLYVVERESKKVQELKTGAGACIDPRFTPDGKAVAFVRAHDVHLVDLSKNAESAVTKGGTEAKPHGLAEFVAQEEMSRFTGYWFSPDAQMVAYQETDHAGLEQFGIADPMHPEAEAERFFYPRPGKANAQVKLFLQARKGGAPVEVKWDRAAFPYLATVRWPKKGALSVLVQNREQTKEQLLAVDVKSGATTVLLTEEDAAWVNLSQEFPFWLPDGSGFLWGTERHGAPEVELRKSDGTLVGPWLSPEAGYGGSAGVNDLVGYDERTKTLYFAGGPDSVATAIYRAQQGQAPERVKTGFTTATENGLLSEDGQLLVVTATSVQAMPKTVVLKTDGTVVGELPSVAKEPTLSLQLELKTVGEKKLKAMVLRPHGYVPGKKLPTILEVYGGPGHQEVVQSLRENLLLQWLADQGFVVVKLDGRGTPRRGRDWERVIKGDFASVPAGDQVEGLQALAKEVPELDLARVGVYGWSFGGYLASVLTLSRGDVFKSGVAGAPVVDWHDYDTHYTERYLGVPPAAEGAYAKSSVLAFVEKAQRPLMLIHGTADDNVYFFHSLKLSDALFRAGKPHRVLPLSNFTHMVPEPLVMERLWQSIAGFFKETL